MPSALELDHVSAFVRETVRLEDLTVTVQRGETVALVGSNSSGKGLALRLGAGLEAPASGSVWLLGLNLSQASEAEFLHLRRRAGIVFEKPALVSNMSVFNNVALPLRYHTTLPESEIRDRVMAKLRECGVDQFRDAFPAELALGDARLAAMARALAIDPEIIFIDELLFGLDADDLVRVRGLVEGFRRAGGLTVVVTINAPTSLFGLMDRLVLLRDGRLVAACSPAEAARVEDPMVKDFFAA
jgi:ABC-type transporter Mla maintaining outer membrane lipid asymmetry ATPase subunit MlaF